MRVFTGLERGAKTLFDDLERSSWSWRRSASYEHPREKANKKRPAIIVTNINGSSVVLIPLSGNTDTIYPFQVLLPNHRTNLESDSKAQTELIRSVSRERLLKHLGGVPEELMLDVDSSIGLHLGLMLR